MDLTLGLALPGDRTPVHQVVLADYAHSASEEVRVRQLAQYLPNTLVLVVKAPDLYRPGSQTVAATVGITFADTRELASQALGNVELSSIERLESKGRVLRVPLPVAVAVRAAVAPHLRGQRIYWLLRDALLQIAEVLGAEALMGFNRVKSGIPAKIEALGGLVVPAASAKAPVAGKCAVNAVYRDGFAAMRAALPAFLQDVGATGTCRWADEYGGPEDVVRIWREELEQQKWLTQPLPMPE